MFLLLLTGWKRPTTVEIESADGREEDEDDEEGEEEQPGNWSLGEWTATDLALVAESGDADVLQERSTRRERST